MAEKDFPEHSVSASDAQLARADLLAGSQSAARAALTNHVSRRTRTADV